MRDYFAKSLRDIAPRHHYRASLRQFSKSPLKEPALWCLSSQFKRTPVGCPCLANHSQAPVQISPGGVRQMVVSEFPAREDIVDRRQSRGGTVEHGDSHGTV
jgi:hypothetical protein